jgi:hypothetical protein
MPRKNEARSRNADETAFLDGKTKEHTKDAKTSDRVKVKVSVKEIAPNQ